MTELRQRMIECLQLRGCPSALKGVTSGQVRQLAEHYHKSPDLITEEDAPVLSLPQECQTLLTQLLESLVSCLYSPPHTDS
jgi:hypothetical protein